MPTMPAHRPMAAWCAETRLTSSGKVLGADGKITRTEAFEAYTLGGAHALRRSDVGSIEVGKRADFAVLDSDPFSVHVDALPDVQVTQTWVDGTLAWP